MTENTRLDILKSLIPFNQLPEEQQNQLEEKGQFMRISENTMLFKRDCREEFYYWVVSGSFDLVGDDHEVKHITAGSLEAKPALNNVNPHNKTAVATSDSAVFKMSRPVVDLMLELVKSDHYMVNDVEDTHEAEADWMSGLLSSPVFQFVPPANIAKLFATFEEVSMASGEAVISQGETGNYFYVIKSGTAKVEQEIGGINQVLANFGVGASFGEDALISEVARNATVTMTSPGVLMRLSKENFGHLLQSPVMHQLETEDADSMMGDGEVKSQFLDVRNPEEFQGSNIANCLNIPLLQLRDRIAELDAETTYITRCDGGKRSALAAFILNSKGIGAYVLREE